MDNQGVCVDNVPRGSGFFGRIWNYLRENIAVLAFIIVIVVFSIAAGQNFLSFPNFANIGRQSAVIIILACGMTMVIVSANIDLSISSTLSLSAMLGALVVAKTGSVVLGILMGLVIGIVVGFVNGILVTKGKIPSFLATLGMMGVVRGLANMVTETKPVVIYEANFWYALGDGDLFGFLPTPIFWTLVLLVITAIVMRYTALGRYIYATGGNQEAARFTGVKTERTIITSFVIMGALASFAGLLLASRMHAARPGTGEGMEMDVIAAVILGGTSLFGGKGTIIGSLVGALVIAALNNGLIIVGFGTHMQMLVRGAVIILAVLFVKDK